LHNSGFLRQALVNKPYCLSALFQFFIRNLVIAVLALFWGEALFAQSASPSPLPETHLHQGKIIRTITIEVGNIFDNPNNYLYRQANELKVKTDEDVVRRELLFKEGDAYDHFLIEESERVLRKLKFFREVEVTGVESGNFVDLKVRVQDTWTFLPQMGFSSGDGQKRTSIGLTETDLFGRGKRAEILYEEEEGRNSIETVYDDNRVWGSDLRFLGAYFDRNDGQRNVFFLGKPFRSLLDKEGWTVSTDVSDTVGRLFDAGDEYFVYRQKLSDLGFRYTFAEGNPEVRLRRYTFGYNFSEAKFSDADQEDFSDINVDPDQLDQDPSYLAENRRFSGPTFSYQKIEPDFISRNYIDRFERVEDFNLGTDFSANVQVAPNFLGSHDDALLFSSNRSGGLRFGNNAFMRLEGGVGLRRTMSDWEDVLMRGEIKYYQVLGQFRVKNLNLGRHTFAASTFVDYGNKLDRDRQFLLGADNVLRGYKTKTFEGDKRAGINLEDRMHFLDDLFEIISLGGAVFLDAGGATRSNLPEIFADDLYADVGFGLRFAFPRSSGERVLRIDVAFPLRDGPDGSKAYEPRIIFAGGQLFGSSLRSETLGPERASVEVGFDR